MTALSALLADVEGSLGHASEGGRSRTLSRITDLLLRDLDHLSLDQVSVFDQVIERVAAASEAAARAALAGRLASVPNPPRRTLLSLATDDDPAIAGPVLTGSPALSDQDLLEIATGRGPEHRVAIASRPRVSEVVADLLVSVGEPIVLRSVAANAGARLSASATATLLDHARGDDVLQERLGGREDLELAQVRQLIEIARESARRRLRAPPPDVGEAEPAPETGARHSYDAARQRLEEIRASRQLTDGDLAAALDAGRLDEAIYLVAELSELPLGRVEEMVEDEESELPLVIGRALVWPWRTVRNLLKTRGGRWADRVILRQAERRFVGLDPGTAMRVLHIVRVQAGLMEVRRA
ncbi:MAG: DUF2336 domain-containing protein [Methylobacteriaceae bacterium]|nr:DUF2336 domain-containing protein [Methylobacteriaceae bacterium]